MKVFVKYVNDFNVNMLMLMIEKINIILNRFENVLEIFQNN